MPVLRLFNISAGVIFLVTGIAKVLSVFGNTQDLVLLDPIFGIEFRKVMLSVGLAEIILAIICLRQSKQMVALSLTAWMSVNYLLYHIGAHVLHWRRPCICMGYLSEGLHLPPWFSEWLSEALVLYLFACSCYLLFCNWRKRKVISQ
jgi:hypothetical protein